MSKPEVFLGNDTNFCLTGSMILNAEQPDVVYSWQDNNAQSNYYVTQEGTYWVDVTNTCGTTRDSIDIISFCDCFLKMPNAFTPNGDGKNDAWRPITDCIIQNYQLRVFNRWGQLVFSSNDAQQAWDGNYKGTYAELGNYVFTIKYSTEDIKNASLYGDVMLIR